MLVRNIYKYKQPNYRCRNKEIPGIDVTIYLKLNTENLMAHLFCYFQMIVM